MYAVFQIGNKQYRVTRNEVICVERLNIEIGDQIKFDQVLMIQDDDFLKIGSPFVRNWLVTAEIMIHGLTKKIKIVKFRRRKHFRKCRGHRQYFTKIKITDINVCNVVS